MHNLGRLEAYLIWYNNMKTYGFLLTANIKYPNSRNVGQKEHIVLLYCGYQSSWFIPTMKGIQYVIVGLQCNFKNPCYIQRSKTYDGLTMSTQRCLALETLFNRLAQSFSMSGCKRHATLLYGLNVLRIEYNHWFLSNLLVNYIQFKIREILLTAKDTKYQR